MGLNEKVELKYIYIGFFVGGKLIHTNFIYRFSCLFPSSACPL